jgi:nitrite reductase/ring-hydroxylating ferredoxin subunit
MLASKAMIQDLFTRLRFALKHRTIGRKVLDSSEPTMILVYHKGKIVRMPRRCPHQGAPLEKGYLKGDTLVCPWHGCHFSLTKNACDHK